ncbi:IclR family transcriptional regulator [Acerihabitans sp. KWT182]|uniref:IclR family transcriptional regulator n=1 Tax=Acerihabitans sp. KWT182 TaxID=3157919 RepID=A0AAU7QEE7_9GAMM
MSKKGLKIQVISRAAQILRSLGSEGLSLGELAQRTGLPRSTVQRIVDALEQENLVDAGESGVRLGWGLNELAKMTYCNVAAKLRHPFETLFTATRETVDIATLRGREVYFLDRIISDQLVRVVPMTDRPKPLYAMANGKAILSCLPDEQIRDLFGKCMPALTEHTLTSVESLLDDIALIRQSGFSYDREEHAQGVCAIGIPLAVPDSAPYAMSVVVPSFRFDARLPELQTILGGVQKECQSILQPRA